MPNAQLPNVKSGEEAWAQKNLLFPAVSSGQARKVLRRLKNKESEPMTPSRLKSAKTLVDVYLRRKYDGAELLNDEIITLLRILQTAHEICGDDHYNEAVNVMNLISSEYYMEAHIYILGVVALGFPARNKGQRKTRDDALVDLIAFANLLQNLSRRRSALPDVYEILFDPREVSRGGGIKIKENEG